MDDKKAPLIVSFGGGVNSAAMLIGLHERSIPADLVLFADTGGEKPHTYDFVKIMDGWLQDHGMPSVTIVRASQKTYRDLEDNCLKQEMLPSIAYGFKGCSHKYKKQPQEVFANNWGPAKAAWESGLKVRKALGIDCDEMRRASIPDDKKYVYEYPLIQWGWGRLDCLAAIKRAGLPNPGKSACFFCPASKKSEIRDLQRRYPELLDRALKMEANAKLDTVKGLGRRFRWSEFIEADNEQGKLFPDVDDLPCGCFDGEGFDEE